MHKRFGDHLSPTVKYWLFLTGIITVIFVVIFASFIASYLHLLPNEQAQVETLFNKLIPFPFIGSIVLVAFLYTMISLLFRYYIIPVLRMAEQTRLITSANSGYRITTEGARELVMLANVINESADAFQKLQEDVDDRIQQANLALTEERNRLAALMSELPCGVVVCSEEGRIQLYNPLAQELLQLKTGGEKSGGPIGLGRSIFDILEQAPLLRALEEMNHAFTAEQVKPALGMMTEQCGTRLIRISLAPVTTAEGQTLRLSGFVLTLEDITGKVDTDSDKTVLSRHDCSVTKTVEERSDSHSARTPRPLSYEFDLFHQPVQEALGKTPLRKLTYVVFDTETTGLNPSEGDEIIQFGAVRIVNGRLLHNEAVDQLVNPQRPVSKSSIAVHGIEPEQLLAQPTIAEVLPGFHNFVADSILVAHNAAFDMRFLQLKEELTGLHFDNPVLDTLLLSSIVHANLQGHSLDAVAERFNITIVGRHTALGDALVTAEILLKLIPLLEAQGINTLDEALAACRKSPYVKLTY